MDTSTISTTSTGTDVTLIDEIYGIKSVNHTYTRDGILFNIKDSHDTFILKTVNDETGRKHFTHLIHSYLQKHGFTNIDSIILTKKHTLTAEINGTDYVCSKVLKGRQCSAESLQDTKKAARLLAKMHNAAKGFTKEEAEKLSQSLNTQSADNEMPYIKCEAGQLTELFQHRARELMRFKKAALRGKGIFDYEYAAVADKFCNAANDACEALSMSKYDEISLNYIKTGIICHKEYSHHNVIFLSEKEGGIVNFDKASIDLPILDTLNLIKRHMKKNVWSATATKEILNEYSKERSIPCEELEIMKIVLSFPQKLWRIVNKYYNSRRAWCEKSCLLKLKEINEESDTIKNFLRELTF